METPGVLAEGRSISQRDVYYCLKDEKDLFSTQSECNCTILGEEY
jgi:hypothetical protein